MNHVVLSSRAQLIWEWIHNTLSPCGRGQGEGCEVVSPRNPLPKTGEGGYEELPLRQQTLADQFQCSRRSIGRCLAELKAAGLLSDTGKRENRVKMYQIIPSPLERELGLGVPKLDEGSKAQAHEPLTLTLSHKGRGDLPSEQPRYITLESFVSNKPRPPIRLLPGESLNPKAAEQWRCYYEVIYWNLVCYDGKNGRPKLEDIYASVTENLTGKDDMEVYSNVFKLLKETPYYEACEESYYRDCCSYALR